MPIYQVGDKVRLIVVPPYLHRGDPIAQETAAFFELCLGKVFVVEGFDENGQLELWTTEKGNRRKVSRGLNSHTIWIEPEYVEPFPKPSHQVKPSAQQFHVQPDRL